MELKQTVTDNPALVNTSLMRAAGFQNQIEQTPPN